MTKSNPAFKRGDVILVLFPHANLRTAKPRPALVVQADNIQTGLPQVIVAMITGRMFRANHPSRVTTVLSTPEGQQSGLLTDSVFMCDWTVLEKDRKFTFDSRQERRGIISKAMFI
ncbi:MAG: type II toxin-antitoxin system PemK/MazF family toxin [Acidobacteria bacterium]|nr:type II toxin-antitoxin system PemK/MazF family toxin [Acidobacteriota bacterium]